MSDYETVRLRMRRGLQRVREQMEAGDDSELLVWAVVNELAGAHRPLRYDPVYGGRGSLPMEAREAVREWAHRILVEGIRTVFCLATEGELRRYDDLELHSLGFLAYLRECGLDVNHLPLTDPAHLPVEEAKDWKENQLASVQRDAAAVYEEAEKPVLVFCSGGADRTPPVAAYLVASPSRSHRH